MQLLCLQEWSQEGLVAQDLFRCPGLHLRLMDLPSNPLPFYLNSHHKAAPQDNPKDLDCLDNPEWGRQWEWLHQRDRGNTLLGKDHLVLEDRLDHLDSLAWVGQATCLGRDCLLVREDHPGSTNLDLGVRAKDHPALLEDQEAPRQEPRVNQEVPQEE